MYKCVCVSLSLSERDRERAGARERARQRQRQRQRQSSVMYKGIHLQIHALVYVGCVYILNFVRHVFIKFCACGVCVVLCVYAHTRIQRGRDID